MPKKVNLLHGRTVLQALPRMESGGAEQGTLNIAQALIHKGCRALVISAGGMLVKQLEAIGAEHISLPVNSKNPLQIIRNAFQLKRIILNKGVDLIHARSRAPAWSALWAARLTHRPFVTTFHAAYPYTTLLKKYYNSVMARGERVIAISSYIERLILAHYDKFLKDKGCVRRIPRGVDCERFNPARISAQEVESLRRQWRIPKGRSIIMLPARITRMKGHVTLIKALRLLPRDMFTCVMVGSSQSHAGYQQELERMVQKSNLSASVIFAGKTDNMPLAYELADIVVSPSLAPEGFGRVLAEAQAMGKPVIAADHGPAHEIIEHQFTGWLFKPGDVDSLAKFISDIAKMSPKEKKILAERARHNAVKHFSLAQMCSKTLAIYEELIKDAKTH